MSETVEFVYEYWDCRRCRKTAIRGDAAHCPECGGARDKNVSFYRIEGREEKIEDANEIERLGVGADWICPFCQTANNHHNKFCTGCGAAYGQRDKKPGRVKTPVPNHTAAERREAPKFKMQAPPRRRISRGLLTALGVVTTLIAGYIFWQYRLSIKNSQVFEVTSVSWSYTVELERYETVTSTAWQGDLPDGAVVVARREKIRRYDQIQTGTRTETYSEKETYQSGTRDRAVTKSVRVQTGERNECKTEYKSIGSGAAKKTTTCKMVPVYGTKDEKQTVSEPVYSDRYVTKSREVPVYTKKAVYDTEVSYRTKAWLPVRTFSNTGSDLPVKKPVIKKPAGEDYRLREPIVIMKAELTGVGAAQGKKFVAMPDEKDFELYRRGARYSVPVDGRGNVFADERRRLQ